MPLSERVHAFPALPRKTFRGPPGLLADPLPDKFGTALIDVWLTTQGAGRAAGSFSAVERLCYIGTRGMGALEFGPALGPGPGTASKIQVDGLVKLPGKVLAHRGDLQVHSHETGKERARKWRS